MSARITGLNVRGLRNSKKLYALQREAKRKGTDVLFLQEVNIKSSGVTDFQRGLAKVGWHAFVSVSNTTDERGGTAILIRQDKCITVESVIADAEHGDSLDGGVCIVDTKIGDNKARLISIYAPQKAGLRGDFFEQLKTSNAAKSDV